MRVHSEPPCRSAARLATIVIATAGLALLGAACGGAEGPGASSSGTASSAHQSGPVAFAGCMRSHRVPNWPDPDSRGVFDKSKLGLEPLGATRSQLQAAQRACNHLLPNGGNGPNAVQRQQMRAQGLEFARCVRVHGVPSFPDPGSDGRIPDPATVGIDQGSPTFEAANDACGRYRPPYLPSNSAYNAYARTHGG